MCLYSVLTGAIEGLYPEVLLDPFKEQLYLPSASVQFCYQQSGDEKVIRQEGKTSVVVLIEEFDPAELIGVIVLGVYPGQQHRLITSQACCFIDWMRVKPAKLGVAFGSDNKKCHALVQEIEPLEIEVAPVHDIKGPGLRDQLVEHVDIMHATLGYREKRRDAAPEIEECMELDSPFCFSKPCLGKQRQEEIDG